MDNYSAKFFLDKKQEQIYLYFNFAAGRLKYYTGFRIEVAKWDFDERKVKKNNVNMEGQTSSFINRELDNIKAKVTKLYEKHDVNENRITPLELKNELKAELGKIPKPEKQNIFDYFEQYIKDAKVSEGRRKHLKVTRNHFERFLNGKSIKFDEITPGILEAFEKFLKNDEPPKGQNTISCNMKRLRTFFSYANEKDWTKSDPFKKFKIVQEKYGDPIYLTKDERDLLYNANLSDNPIFDKIRDIFLFQCFIGARVGDMIKLTYDNIINDCITYIQDKTIKEEPVPVTIPLTEKAKAILSKYNLPDKKLLPFIEGQWYNVYLKDVFVKVGLNRKIVRINPNTGKEEIVRLCDIASSHMARRTFIGILYENGIKNDIIGSMSGHAKGSKAFGRYYSVSEKLKQEAIKGLD
jgi:integrase